MKITTQHVEAMLQELFELGERMSMAPLPVAGIIMPNKAVEQRYRIWMRPAGPDSNQTITYYEGTQKECSIYAAELTMRLALEKVFGSVGPLGLVSNEPRDSLSQSDGDTAA